MAAPRLDKQTVTRIAALKQIYARARRDLQHELRKATLSDFQRFRYGEHLKQVKAITTALDAVALNAAPFLADRSYAQGVDLSADALRAAGVSLGNGINLGNRIHTAAAGAVADQMAADLLAANRDMRDLSTRILRHTQQMKLEERRIQQTIAEGIVRGRTARETTAQLTDDLQKALGDGKFITAGKMQFTPESYAEIVSLTMTREATVAGSINTALEFGVELFQVSVHAGSCEICLPYQGRVYSLTGKDPDFPRLEERPPYHPRCRHDLLAYVRTSDEEHRALKKLSDNSDRIVAGPSDYKRVMGRS